MDEYRKYDGIGEEAVRVWETSEMVSFWGYPSEEYDVVTEDGYILQINRIPYGRGNAESQAFKAFSTMPQLAQKTTMCFALLTVDTVTFLQSPFKNLTFFSDYGLKSRVGAYRSRSPAGTSVQNVIHWLQGVQSGVLRAYDRGTMYNSLCCIQMSSPLYKVKGMEVLMPIWHGGADCLADAQDVALLLPQVKNLVHHRVIPQWNHLVFLQGLDATKVLYQEVVDMMKKHP